uniref:RGS domain-containing protein n=1 Tax=Xiphophorus couchianus TaxID=32473 RepID=A0A3B5LNF6_9TELE
MSFSEATVAPRVVSLSSWSVAGRSRSAIACLCEVTLASSGARAVVISLLTAPDTISSNLLTRSERTASSISSIRFSRCSLASSTGAASGSGDRPSEGEVMRWAYSLEALLTNQYGVAVFRDFLRSEFSEENLDFWLAVEKFKRTPSLSKMTTQARRIYDQFLSPCAARKVNVDSTNHSLSLGVNPASFQRAQDQIFSLMEADSYPRFLKSHLNAQLANHNTGTAVELSNQTNQSVID